MKKSYNKHLKLLADAFYANITFDNDDCWELGSIGLDSKRPFGNSNVEFDILKIIEMKPDSKNANYTDEQYRYASELYCQKLVPYLKKQWKIFNKLTKENNNE